MMMMMIMMIYFTNLHKGVPVNFDALFNCYAVMLCSCGGMKTQVHFVY